MNSIQAAKNIALVGFMGVGKTTAGKLAAARLGFSFIDTDDCIEKIAKQSIPHIFQIYGESYFRDLESQAVSQAAMALAAVIATGGGVVKREKNIWALRENGLVIYLKAGAEKIADNIAGDQSRPLLQGEDRMAVIRRLLAEREALYQKSSHLVIEIDDKTPEEVAVHIVAAAKAVRRKLRDD